MASQLRFEGAELEDLLERVRDEVGPDARIIGANRIRKGGLGGFFAKEGFEVVVDMSAEQTCDAQNARDAESAQPAFTPPPGRPRSARVAASVLDLAEEVSQDEREQVIDLSEPAVSTERGDFGAMLARLSRELDEEEALEVPGGVPIAPSEHYRRVTSDAPSTAPTGAAPTDRTTTPQPAIMPLPDYAPAPDARLLALGLPREFVPSAAAHGDLRTALVQRLAQCPAPPAVPRTSGVVIAIVGIGTAPIALARRLADELDIDPDHVMLATPEAMSDITHPEDAEALRRSCRRRPEATIVACSIGAGRAQLGWAHRILDRLEPTVTWAVIEASCKSEDIAHRISLLGGIDVLALTGVADTVSPAAALALGVAVGRIGSKPATPAVWADLLMERLDR